MIRSYLTFSTRQRGLSLIELMISLLLGLLLVGGAITVFMSNRMTYRATENMGRMQESGRVAFELVSRDLREGGGTACEYDIPVVSLLGGTAAWWKQWDHTGTVAGFESTVPFPDAAFGTGAGQRITGTDAMQIMASFSNGVWVDAQAALSDPLTVNTTAHGFVTGDLAMVCTFEGATVFQITAASNATRLLAHAASGVPGNSSGNLGIAGVRTVCRNYNPSGCTNWPAIVARVSATRWFVANNGRGTTSLYRTSLVRDEVSNAVAPVTTEIAENVSDLQLEYLVNGTYFLSSTVPSWQAVSAIRATITLSSPEVVNPDGTRLNVTMQNVIALRNRSL